VPNILTGDDRFRLLVDSMPELVWVSGVDKRCIYVNRQWLDFTGRSLMQELGDGWTDRVHPDDHERRCDMYRSSLDRREVFSMEYRLRRRDGSYRWLLDTGRPWFLADGEFAGYVGSATDITERKRGAEALHESEERFQLVAGAIDGVFRLMEINPQRMLYVSPAFERFWGVPVQDLYNDPHLWTTLIHPEDRDKVERILFSWNTGERTDYDVEYRLQGRDGIARWIHDRGAAICDDAGKPIRLSGMAEDITGRKQIEEEREQLQRQLYLARKMVAVGHLAGGVAHDFNNILASILGYTGLALTRLVPDKQSKLAEYLLEVYRAGERAQDLMGQMLAFSRATGKDSKLQKLEPLVGAAAKLLQATLPSSIELNLQLDDDTPAVLVDSVQLHQLMINLCVNARDAITGFGRIDIYLRRVPNANVACCSCHERIQGDFVELVVKDTGVGIEAEVMQHMFAAFFSSKESATTGGMGLSIVHDIIHDHGGHIAVESTPGIGSAFRVLFPVSQTVVQSASGERLAGAREPAVGHRIMVVDDDESTAGFIAEFLDGRGYLVKVTTDSNTALQGFKDDVGGFDLVVMDQIMPGMTGTELAEALLRINPGLPIILCTGYSEEIDETRARTLGIRGYLTKPLSAGALLGKVEGLLVNPLSAHPGGPA